MFILNTILLENELQDDVLDYMNDKNLSFDELSKTDKYILRYGDYPEHIKREQENTYVGLENVLYFIFDNLKREMKQTGTYQTKDMPGVNIEETITITGTIIYNNIRYKGYILLTPNKTEVEFINNKNVEFDPRNNKEHYKAMTNMFNEVLKDKLTKKENKNNHNKMEIKKLNEFNKVELNTRQQVLQILSDVVLDEKFPDIGEVNGVTTDWKTNTIYLHGDLAGFAENEGPTIMLKINIARGVWNYDDDSFRITESVKENKDNK